MNGTVTVRLVGGLGNQMFQYAASLGLAERQGRSLKLDLSAFQAYKAWPYQLDRLNVPQDLYTGPPLAGPASQSLLARITRKLRGGYRFREGVYREPHFHFDPNIFALSGDEILLDGYFQSPRYFEAVSGLLRQRFVPIAPLTPIAAAWSEEIAASRCSVSIHVRRGDYLSVSASTAHVALDRGYYRRAASLMTALLGSDCDFFLFSDDPDFVAHAFADLPRATVVRSDERAPWEDMFLMARCQHNIIANSSYSWWGAWLNTHDGRRVIAPARWFAPAKLASTNVLDMFPEDWILLQ